MPAKYNQNDQPSCLNKAEFMYDGGEVSAENTLLFVLALCVVPKHRLMWPGDPWEQVVTSLWQRRISVCWLCQKQIGDSCLPLAAPAIPVAAGFMLQFAMFTLLAPDLFLCLRCYSRGKKRSLILSQQMKVLSQPNIYHLIFPHTANNHQNQRKITASEEVYTTSWGRPASRQLGLKREKCHPLSQNCKESVSGLRRQDCQFRNHIQPLQSAMTQSVCH